MKKISCFILFFSLLILMSPTSSYGLSFDFNNQNSADEAFKGERRYFCLVDDFKTRGDENLKFIEENKKKSFLILISESEIFVKSLSEYYSSSEDIYKIIENKNINKNSITGVSSDSYTFETFFFDEVTRSGNITKHLHFSFVTWLISCKREFN